MITIYTIAWNEEQMILPFIVHYRSALPGCKIVVYSNESTDRTDDIARENGCEVRTFKTGNTLSDRTYLEIKNNAWKEEKGWVLIADVDEHIWIPEKSLKEQQEQGVTIIRGKGYNMVSDDDKQIYSTFDITRGVRAPSYDKLYCFDTRAIQEINYNYGCHKANPIGIIKYNTQTFICRHYKYLNLPYILDRHSEFAKRMSDHNKLRGLGSHYLYTPEEITNEFNEARRKAITV